MWVFLPWPGLGDGNRVVCGGHLSVLLGMELEHRLWTPLEEQASGSLEPKPDFLDLIPFSFAQLSIFLTEMPHG